VPLGEPLTAHGARGTASICLRRWFHEANHSIRNLAVTPAAATEEYCFLDEEREKTREDILSAFGILCSLA
jgi:hypothetical protein